MSTVKGRNIEIEFVDFFFKNKPVLEDKVVDITYDNYYYTGGWRDRNRTRKSNFYMDYDIELDSDLSITYYDILNCYSYDSNNLIFNLEYYKKEDKDIKSFEDYDYIEGDYIDKTQKEIPYKALMSGSKFIGTERFSFGGWREGFSYRKFFDLDREYIGEEELNEYGERTRKFKSDTQPTFDIDEEKTSLKITSVTFNIDCRNSIYLGDWNVLEMVCSFY